jgi:hypothetical protein
MVETSPVAWWALGVAVGSFLVAAGSLGWQIWTHTHRPQAEVRVKDALRRSDEERQALSRLLGQIPAVVTMCSSYIEQFPEDAPPSTVTIPPRKVANRLGTFQEAWRKEASRIRSQDVRGAYNDIGVDRVLQELLSEGPDVGPTFDHAAVVPVVKGLRASVESLEGVMREATR